MDLPNGDDLSSLSDDSEIMIEGGYIERDGKKVGFVTREGGAKNPNQHNPQHKNDLIGFNKSQSEMNEKSPKHTYFDDNNDGNSDSDDQYLHSHTGSSIQSLEEQAQNMFKKTSSNVGENGDKNTNLQNNTTQNNTAQNTKMTAPKQPRNIDDFYDSSDLLNLTAVNTQSLSKSPSLLTAATSNADSTTITTANSNLKTDPALSSTPCPSRSGLSSTSQPQGSTLNIPASAQKNAAVTTATTLSKPIKFAGNFNLNTLKAKATKERLEQDARLQVMLIPPPSLLPTQI